MRVLDAGYVCGRCKCDYEYVIQSLTLGIAVVLIDSTPLPC